MFNFAKKWLQKFGNNNFKKLINSKIYYVGNAMYSKKYLIKNFQKRIKLFIYHFHILKKDILRIKIFLFRLALLEPI